MKYLTNKRPTGVCTLSTYHLLLPLWLSERLRFCVLRAFCLALVLRVQITNGDMFPKLHTSRRKGGGPDRARGHPGVPPSRWACGSEHTNL